MYLGPQETPSQVCSASTRHTGAKGQVTGSCCLCTRAPHNCHLSPNIPKPNSDGIRGGMGPQGIRPKF